MKYVNEWYVKWDGNVMIILNELWERKGLNYKICKSDMWKLL